MFKEADVIVFIGGYPRKPGMERKDLLQKNKAIFVEQSHALKLASPDVKCVVVANPANTNTLILSHFAPTVKKENITCLTRLDHNRAISQIISKTGAKQDEIEGVYIFGNHSLTQYPCINNIKVKGRPILELVEREWLEKTFIPKVQKRGGEILEVRGGSSVFSAASATVDHLRDWYTGSNQVVSMGVASSGDYDIPKGLWTSLPVRCLGNFKYEVVKDVPLSDYCRDKIKATVKEL
jgi:malate dehydrogenase